MKAPALLAALATGVAGLAHAQPPGAPVEEGLGVRLNLVYPEPRVVLQQAPISAAQGRTVPDSAWTDVCRSPCQSDAHAATVYRVAGSNMFPSRAFAIPPRSGLVHVDVEPSNKTLYWSGIGLTAIGSIVFISAIVLFNQMGPEPRKDEQFKRDAMVWCFWLGPSAMLGGGILWARNHSTELSIRY